MNTKLIDKSKELKELKKEVDQLWEDFWKLPRKERTSKVVSEVESLQQRVWQLEIHQTKYRIYKNNNL